MDNNTEQFSERLSRQRKNALVALQFLGWFTGFAFGVILTVMCLRGFTPASFALLMAIAIAFGGLNYAFTCWTASTAEKLEDIGHTRGRCSRGKG